MPTIADRVLGGAAQSGRKRTIADSVLGGSNDFAPAVEIPDRLPFANDMGPGAARPPEGGRVAVPSTFVPPETRPGLGLLGHLPSKLSEALDNAGLTRVSSKQAEDRFGGQVKAFLDNIGIGLARLPLELPVAALDDPVEFVRGIPGFFGQAAQDVTTATTGKEFQVFGQDPTLANFDVQGLRLEDAPAKRKDEAKERLFTHPEAPILAALGVRGALRGGTAQVARGGLEQALSESLRGKSGKLGARAPESPPSIAPETKPQPTLETALRDALTERRTPPDIVQPRDFPTVEPGRAVLPGPKRDILPKRRQAAVEKPQPAVEPAPGIIAPESPKPLIKEPAPTLNKERVSKGSEVGTDLFEAKIEKTPGISKGKPVPPPKVKLLGDKPIAEGPAADLTRGELEFVRDTFEGSGLKGDISFPIYKHGGAKGPKNFGRIEDEIQTWRSYSVSTTPPFWKNQGYNPQEMVRIAQKALDGKKPLTERQAGLLKEAIKDYKEFLIENPSFDIPLSEFNTELATAAAKDVPVRELSQARKVAEPDLPKVTALKKEEITRLRSELELDKLDPVKRRTNIETLDRAKAEKFDEKALTVAQSVTSRKGARVITPEEHAGMVLKAAERMNEYEKALAEHSKLLEKGEVDAARFEFSRSEAILDEINLLTEASDLAGREAGRALQIRKMAINRQTYDLAKVVQRAQAAKGKKLTPEEIERFRNLTEEHKATAKKLQEIQERVDKLEAEREKLVAEKVAERIAKRNRIASKAKSSRERIRAERADVLKQLADLGFRLNDATGLTIEGSYLVGKLAATYIKEGAVTLAEVTQKVLTHLPELTERDVIKALAQKEKRLQDRARSEAVKRKAQLVRQARLIEKVENAQKGIFEPTKQRTPAPPEIRALQKEYTKLRTEAYRSSLEADKLDKALQKINELQDMLAGQYRKVKKRRPVPSAELKAAREKANEIRRLMDTKDKIARIDDQLRTGDFEIRTPKPEKPIPPELERAQVELKRKRNAIRDAIDAMAPITPKKVLFEAQNTLRTMKATADMSSVLRQGLLPNVGLLIRKPSAIPEAFVGSFKSFWKKNTAETIDNAIRAHPNQFLRDRAGLQLTEVGRPGAIQKGRALTVREEAFMSEVAERIPVLGGVVRASERHMATNLNMLRSSLFDTFVEKYPNATAAELKAWADYINVTSGRGNLNSFSTAGVSLSTVFFAPKFAVSRLQTPLMLFKHWKLPRVRREIAKDYAAFATIGATVLVLADMAGGDVSMDPESSDFGKVKVGNTRFDFFAGFQQPARLMFQVALQGANPEPAGFGQTPIELVERFAAFKLSPTVTLSSELIGGRNVIGQEVTPTETALNAITPLVYQDIAEAYKDGGLSRAALSGSASFFGVGTNTFESRVTKKFNLKRKRRTRSRSRRGN